MTRWTKKLARPFIYQPTEFDNKYTRGVLGAVTGSIEFPGAAVLSTFSAMQTGVGMVRFHPLTYRFSRVPRNFVERLVLEKSPEVVISPGAVTAWLVGSGVSAPHNDTVIARRRQRDIAHALKHPKPTILDAGALHYAGQLNSPTLLTPHYGELARLLNERGVAVTSTQIAAHPEKWVVEAAVLLRVTVLLKGSITYLSDGVRTIELPESTPWLSTAGTGDVLAGILGALVATHGESIASGEVELLEIGATGAFIHHLAAEHASRNGPVSAMKVAHEISTAVSSIINK